MERDSVTLSGVEDNEIGWDGVDDGLLVGLLEVLEVLES